MSKENLKSLRLKIDKIDKDLLKLIQKRAALAVSIGKIKSKISPNTSFYKPDREATILRNILKACLLYTSPSPRDPKTSRMPSSA